MCDNSVTRPGSENPASLRPTGLTLLEVSLAVAVLSTTVLAVFGLFLTSERLATIAREESLALYAAEEIINEIRSKPFKAVLDADPGTRQTVLKYHHHTRPVNLVGAVVPAQRLGQASAPVREPAKNPDGLKCDEELGVIIISDETPCESDYGDVDNDGDLDFPVDLDLNGQFGDTLDQLYADQAFLTRGVTLAFPMDLGGTRNAIEDALPGNPDEQLDLLRLVPLAVVVRWTSVAGTERRVQVLTFITDREGGM